MTRVNLETFVVLVEKMSMIYIYIYIMKADAIVSSDCQYHGCWCLSDTRGQGISSDGIDLVIQVYPIFILSIRRVNSLPPSDIIWCPGTWSTLVQVMACCLMAPSHHLNQCWLIICEILWHSPEGYFTVTGSAQDIFPWSLVWISLIKDYGHISQGSMS